MSTDEKVIQLLKEIRDTQKEISAKLDGVPPGDLKALSRHALLMKCGAGLVKIVAIVMFFIWMIAVTA